MLLEAFLGSLVHYCVTPLFLAPFMTFKALSQVFLSCNLSLLMVSFSSAVVSVGIALPWKKKDSNQITVCGIINSYGMNQPQGIQSHKAGADVHTEDLTRKGPEDTVFLSYDHELSQSYLRKLTEIHLNLGKKHKSK